MYQNTQVRIIIIDQIRSDQLIEHLLCPKHCASLLSPVHVQPCLTLCYSMDCSPPGSLSMGFSRQEYWSGLPCPPPGDLLDPGIKPKSPAAPALAVIFFITDPPGKPPLSSMTALQCMYYYSHLDLPNLPPSGSSQLCI